MEECDCVCLNIFYYDFSFGCIIGWVFIILVFDCIVNRLFLLNTLSMEWKCDWDSVESVSNEDWNMLRIMYMWMDCPSLIRLFIISQSFIRTYNVHSGCLILSIMLYKIN